MKTARATSEKTILDDIVATLKRVPRARLGVVRAVVQALADTEPPTGRDKAKARKKLSLLDTPFCGMWADREDITDERTYARQLRKRLETGGDRGKNLR
jgi:hypothetical protein